MIKTQEELAELHEAFSHFLAKRKPIDAVGDEVSNSLDWICSAWGILYSNISLDHTIIDYYYEDCPFCHKHPCSCKPRMDRVSQLVDSSRILRIEEQIGELSSLLGARDPEMDELRKSLAAARETQSEPIARQAVANTKQKLESIADGLSRTNEAGKRINSIIDSVSSVIKMLPF